MDPTLWLVVILVALFVLTHFLDDEDSSLDIVDENKYMDVFIDIEPADEERLL